ncbi:crossover junction endodeoxyribonuclease RuvC [Bacillus sp. NTK034]|uniref:crossover junction endodeoxyribonuclease RuvC n=1 Tax=Bacillus sp. NTK034 TaxID=2802176 RepID=UPI001A903C84|nr:crossover junction endodeoxyribonuclease RuvC [Bacillus sp. NTK034]MBN8200492.1 crossover junction endodeoxyribonuclease RuvC [Bacillus sp. NTK034]
MKRSQKRFVGIDPSTKTGIVVLSEQGEVIESKEITTTEKEDPKRMMDIAKKVINNLWFYDVICIEGFSYGSRGAGVSTQYGIGWLIRAELIRNGYTYYEVAPSAVKKFATGKGNTKKDEMVLPIYKKWGFEHSSDNVRDAYVLAQIAKAIHNQEGLKAYQMDVMKKVIA